MFLLFTKRNSYLLVGKKNHRIKRRLMLAGIFVFGFCSLLSCGVQVGVNDNYISERNVPYVPQQQGQAYSQPPREQNLAIENHPRTAKAIIATARSQKGVPYRIGGTTPQRGFDCSGLIQWVYKQHGISVPRLAKAQSTYGRAVDFKALQPGDIVAFKIQGGYHTGIYSGGGMFIHSPSSGQKVREESINIKYWRSHFISGRRFL
ncbi:C40 family peptidase [Desulfovibrio sp. OttesenSCG-928-F07]|nr:C40 family peptidase [Desulfovibrio sp. OttesenSCG-928-F07]